jgi:hypothetical protein
MNEDDVLPEGCAYGLVLAGLLWVVILVAAAVVLSRVAP